MTADTIDIGIINFNGGDHLLHCIASLRSMHSCTPSIHVLDNASSDESFARAREAFPECMFIHSTRNLGYAGGINRLLMHMKSDIVVFCNMDLEFPADWGATILSCFRSLPDVQSVASLVMEKESGNVYSSAVRFFWDLFPLSSKEAPATDTPYDVVSAYGAVMAFRRALFEKTGTFDKDYFLFFEETEFYLRMHINQMRTVLCPVARVFHHRSTATIRFSSTKLFFSERNRILTAFKYLPLWYFPLIFPLSLLRFGLMSRSGIPQKDGKGTRITRFSIVKVLLSAWLAALWYLPREWWKRSALWKQVPNGTYGKSAVLHLISKYRLSLRDLRLS